MKLSEWLEIQGASKLDYLFYDYKNSYGQIVTRCSIIDANSLLAEESLNEFAVYQLYRPTNGELRRVDKPVVTCVKCGKGVLRSAASVLEFCPDCQKKEEKRIVCRGCSTEILEKDAARLLWWWGYGQVPTCPKCQSRFLPKQVKIKIKPCPRCGSRDLRAFIDNWHDLGNQKIVCRNCDYSNWLSVWDIPLTENEKYTDITDQLEVEE